MNKLAFLVFTFSLLPAFFSCGKKNDCNTTATITHTGTPCPFWGIIVGTTYLSNNIPDQFKQEGLQVCVEYELYQDITLCACCGGTRARIINMSLPPD